MSHLVCTDTVAWTSSVRAAEAVCLEELTARVARERLLRAARGRYQEALARGQASWAGSDLRGQARAYAGRYARSRRSLLARAGLTTMIVCRRRVLAVVRPCEIRDQAYLLTDRTACVL